MKWLRDRSYKVAAKELAEALHGDSLDLIREDVFFLYKGDPNDPLLFALQDCLSRKMTIGSYHSLYGWMRKLIDRLEREGL